MVFKSVQFEHQNNGEIPVASCNPVKLFFFTVTVSFQQRFGAVEAGSVCEHYSRSHLSVSEKKTNHNMSHEFFLANQE